MQNIVTYVLGLQSGQFESGLARANGSVNALEASINGITKALGAIAVAGVAFNFLNDTVRMFNESEQASAQLNATLKSTGNIAMLNREALDKQAQSIMQNSLFDDDAITGAQSVLATFTQIKSEVFNNAIPAIADLATKMGGDLQGATIQVGKALNDPIKGVSALQRVGVSFTASQKELIKSLVDTGNAAEAQKMILAELNTEFGGSAKASAEAGTGALVVLQHEWGNVKEEIGGVVMVLVKDFMPELRNMVNGLKNAIAFIKEHKDGLMAIGKALFAAYTSMKLMAIGETIYKALSAAALTSATSFEALGVAIGASLGPIGLAAVAIGGLVGAYSLLNDAEEKRDRLKEKRAVSNDALASQEALRVDALIAEGRKAGISKDEIVNKEYNRVLTLKKDNLALLNAPATTTVGFGENKFDVENRMNKIEVKDAEYEAMLRAIPKENNIGTSKSAAVKALTNKSKTANTGAPKFDKAQGQKSITINVSIKDLIGTYNSTVTNVQGNATKIKEAVLGALTGAVNDFQIVAGQ